MKFILFFFISIAFSILYGCSKSLSSEKKISTIGHKVDSIKPFIHGISNDKPSAGWYLGSMVSIFRNERNVMRINNFSINETTKKINGDAYLYYYPWVAPTPDGNADFFNQRGETWDSFVKLPPDVICAACSDYRAKLDSIANPKPTEEHYNLVGFATHDSVFFQVDTVYPVNENGELLERHLRFRGKGMKYSITNDYPPHHFIIGTFIDSTLEVSPYYGTFILGD